MLHHLICSGTIVHEIDGHETGMDAYAYIGSSKRGGGPLHGDWRLLKRIK